MAGITGAERGGAAELPRWITGVRAQNGARRTGKGDGQRRPGNPHQCACVALRHRSVFQRGEDLAGAGSCARRSHHAPRPLSTDYGTLSPRVPRGLKGGTAPSSPKGEVREIERNPALGPGDSAYRSAPGSVVWSMRIPQSGGSGERKYECLNRYEASRFRRVAVLASSHHPVHIGGRKYSF